MSDLPDKPCIWKILRKFQNLSPDGFPNLPEKDARYKAQIPYTKLQLVDEIDKMENLLGENSVNDAEVVLPIMTSYWVTLSYLKQTCK